MIKVSLLYPNQKGKRFDMDYFLNKHVPMTLRLLGDSVKQGAIDEGLSGAEPGSQAPYVAMGHIYFESMDDFNNSFGPNSKAIFGDFPNYTDIEPVIQISEVKV